MAEKFSLKWNDFNQNVSKTFSSLRHQEDFYDVTLVSDDQEQFSAHKVVLSACSEYFGNVLKKNKHSHPLLCLQGIRSNDLNCLLDFIYNGVAQVFQDEIDKFLQIAKQLQLKGLIEDTKFQNFPTNTQNVKHEYKENRNPLINTVELEDSDIGEQVAESSYTSLEVPNSSIVINSSDIREINEKIEEFLEKVEGGGYNCKTCGKYSKKKDHIRKHVETHLEGLSFPCNTCGKIFRSSNALYTHIYKHKCTLQK